MALHRYVTNNAGQLYLTIEVNCKEACLMLWGSHSTSTHKYKHFILPLNKIADK